MRPDASFKVVNVDGPATPDGGRLLLPKSPPSMHNQHRKDTPHSTSAANHLCSLTPPFAHKSSDDTPFRSCVTLSASPQHSRTASPAGPAPLDALPSFPISPLGRAASSDMVVSDHGSRVANEDS